MIKCKHKGIWTCISKNGTPKKKYDTQDKAIKSAIWANEKWPIKGGKRVAYKCSNCFKYHLTTTYKKMKL